MLQFVCSQATSFGGGGIQYLTFISSIYPYKINIKKDSEKLSRQWQQLHTEKHRYTNHSVDQYQKKQSQSNIRKTYITYTELVQVLGLWFIPFLRVISTSLYV